MPSAQGVQLSAQGVQLSAQSAKLSAQSAKLRAQSAHVSEMDLNVCRAFNRSAHEREALLWPSYQPDAPAAANLQPPRTYLDVMYAEEEDESGTIDALVAAYGIQVEDGAQLLEKRIELMRYIGFYAPA